MKNVKKSLKNWTRHHQWDIEMCRKQPPPAASTTKISKDWRNNTTILILKKGWKSLLENYGEITLLNTIWWRVNVATTIKIFDKPCVICLQQNRLFKDLSTTFQMYKCDPEERPPQLNALTWFFYNWTRRSSVRVWFSERKSSSRKLRCFPIKCTKVGFSSQSQT